MKVILINRYFYPDESATSRMVTSLALSLSASGWPVQVLASRNLHNDDTVRLPPRETVKDVQVRRLWTTTFGREWLPGRAVDYGTFHLSAIWHLLREAGRDDICIVCTDPPMLSVSALLPVTLKGTVLVNWLLDLFPEVAMELGIGKPNVSLMRTALWLRDRSLHRARCNVAPIQRMSEYLKGRGVAPARLTTIHHWADGHAIRPVEPRDNGLRKEWGLGDRFVVGYSGNFGRAHDFSTFLGAAARLRDNENIVFVFVGGGHQKGAIEAAVAELGLKNVLLKPLQPRDRLAETLGVADLHLVSLLPVMEPFIIPSKLYGILAAGRATAFVGDLSGEIATILEAGVCGRSVPPGDSEGLAQIILELAENRGLAARLGKNARRLFDQRFVEAAGTAAWQRLLVEHVQAPLLPAPHPAP